MTSPVRVSARIRYPGYRPQEPSAEIRWRPGAAVTSPGSDILLPPETPQATTRTDPGLAETPGYHNLNTRFAFRYMMRSRESSRRPIWLICST